MINQRVVNLGSELSTKQSKH